MPQTKPKASL